MGFFIRLPDGGAEKGAVGWKVGNNQASKWDQTLIPLVGWLIGKPQALVADGSPSSLGESAAKELMICHISPRGAPKDTGVEKSSLWPDLGPVQWSITFALGQVARSKDICVLWWQMACLVVEKH